MHKIALNLSLLPWLSLAALTPPVAPTNTTGNVEIMGDALFCSGAHPTGDLLAVESALVGLSSYEYMIALQGITPVQISSFPILEMETNDRFLSLVQNRIYRYNEQLCDCLGMLPDWTVWATPMTYWFWQKAQTGIFAFDSNTAGFVIGFENNPVDELMVGFGLGYAYSGVTWKNGGGKGVMNGFYWSPYLTYRWEDLSFAASIMGSYDAVQLNRHLDFSTINRTTTANMSDWNLTTMLQTQAFLRLKGEELYLLPEGQIVFTQLFRQSTAESGGGSLNMQYASNFNSSMRIFLNGAAGFRTCVRSGFIMDLRAHIGYQNTQFFTRNTVQATFRDAPGICNSTVVLNGSTPAENQGVAGGSLSWQNQEEWKLEVKGDYTFGGRSHALELDLAMEFNF